jgi:hypothetical protein
MTSRNGDLSYKGGASGIGGYGSVKTAGGSEASSSASRFYDNGDTSSSVSDNFYNEHNMTTTTVQQSITPQFNGKLNSGSGQKAGGHPQSSSSASSNAQNSQSQSNQRSCK